MECQYIKLSPVRFDLYSILCCKGILVGKWIVRNSYNLNALSQVPIITYWSHTNLLLLSVFRNSVLSGIHTAPVLTCPLDEEMLDTLSEKTAYQALNQTIWNNYKKIVSFLFLFWPNDWSQSIILTLAINSISLFFFLPKTIKIFYSELVIF